jgi:hypothetical protein
MEKEITITLKIKGDTPFRLKDKVNMFEKFSRLGAEDQQRMTEIMDSKNALKGLAENWKMLQQMFK